LRFGVRLLLAASVASFFAAAPSLARAAVPTTSCAAAAAPASSDRKTAINGGRSIEVVYAHPADVADGFGTMASRIATDIATGHAWLLREDPTRAFRFDLFPFPGCAGDIANLDIADVTLPEGAAAYAPLGGRFQRLITQLRGAPFGFNSNLKKYIVYLDAPVNDTNVCGQGGGNPAGQGYAFIYMQTCRQNVGDGLLSTVVAFHELLHSFGLVDDGAPHQCAPPDDGHTCDNRSDILYPYTFGDPIDAMLLDPGRDDYWGHNGGWIDGRKSMFLIKLDAGRHQVNVGVAGSGTALVESDLPGISCATSCSTTWDQGEAFTLTATAGARTRFVGFTGACATTDTRCSVTVDGAKTVTATFAAQVPLMLEVGGTTGSGSVVSNPARLSCPSQCSADFDQGATVALEPHAGSGSRFEGWGGACSGTGLCTVTMDGAKTVSASFGSVTRVLRVARAGKGTITSAPRGISCPGRCAAAFAVDGTVRLSAKPAKGYRFTGWSGACRGRGACAVKLDADKSVKATFKKK
jgi:hypothetical protein